MTRILPPHTRRLHAYSLLEISVVLSIIALVVGMSASAGKSMLDIANYNNAKERLVYARAALDLYQMKHKRYPCPAVPTDAPSAASYGQEATSCATSCPAGLTCVNNAITGFLPFNTLGTYEEEAYDPWNKRISYTVDKTHTATSEYELGTIPVQDKNGNLVTASTVLGKAIYVLVSHGRDGNGGYTKPGALAKACGATAKDSENCDADDAFMDTRLNESEVAANFYDDAVIWQTQRHVEPHQEDTTTTTCSGGNLYVTDQGNNRVQKFDMTGTYVSKFGTAGTGNGQFAVPQGIAFDTSGNIWVADGENNRVQKFDSSGTYVSKFGTGGNGNGQFANPSGIAFDSSGNIWVADQQNYRVQKFDSSGTYLMKFGSHGTGNGQFNEPTDIKFNASGNLWVAQYADARVQKFDSNGNYVCQFGTSGTGNGQFGSVVFGMAIDATGNIWVADWNNDRVQKFDSSGTYVSKFGTAGSGNGQFDGADTIAIDDSGNIWVTDSANNRVQKFDSSGTYVSKFGTAGSGNGQFNGPNYIACH